MRRFLALGLVCGGLAACSLPNPWQFKVPTFPAAPGNLAENRAKCDRMYPAKIGNYLPHAECVNQAIESDAIPYARYPDLIRTQEQLRVKYSAMIDRGRISPREGMHKMAFADQLVEAAMKARDTNRPDAATHLASRLQMMAE